MTELKPCPFCGKDATSFSESQGWDVYGNNEYRAYAGCTNDKCGIGIDLWHTGDDMCDERDDGAETASLLEDKAIAIWNTRAERTCRDDGVGVFRCTACGAFAKRVAVMDCRGAIPIRYCPNCGSKVVSE
jgi:hypothetical protein